MKPLIPKTVLEIDKIKLHQDLVNVIGLNISEGILACAGMANEKILSKAKENQYIFTKEELIELISSSFDARSKLDYFDNIEFEKEQFINNLLNQQ